MTLNNPNPTPRRESDESDELALYKSNERAMAILRVLVQKGTMNKYQICEALRTYGSRPTIFYIIVALENLKCIEAVRVDRHARGPKPSKFYDVTDRGVAMLIASLDVEGSEDFLDRLLEKCRQKMPMTFELLSASIKASKWQWQGWGLREMLPGKFGLFERVRTESGNLDESFLNSLLIDPLRESEEWMQFVRENPHLRESAVRCIMTDLEDDIRKTNELLKSLGAPEVRMR